MDTFTKIDNAISDLKEIKYSGYQGTHKEPMQRLANALRGKDFAEFNKSLTEDVDVDEFIQGLFNHGGLDWPEDDKKVLGLKLLLIDKFIEDSDYISNFGRMYGSGYGGEQEDFDALVEQFIVRFMRDYKLEYESFLKENSSTPVSASVKTIPAATNKILIELSVKKDSSTPISASVKNATASTNKVFIVHGHDGEALHKVARFIEKIKLEAIILEEQANQGQTIIEKLEKNADVSFVVVLLTPDDVFEDQDSNKVIRARQNVILEFGYFFGRLGRDKICILRKGNIEIPSDFQGIVLVELDKNNGWKQELVKELNAAGHSVSLP